MNFDLIGDQHGCVDELRELLSKLGYVRSYLNSWSDEERNPKPEVWAHPDRRQVVYCGDITDRGPDSLSVLRIVKNMVEGGFALAVLGNHCDKLRRALRPGSKVKPAHGLAETLKQLETISPEEREEIRLWLETLPYQLVLDDGKLVVAHAGLPEAMHGVDNGRVRSHALYGDVEPGKTDERGYPVRRDWAQNYHGKAVVVHGHTPMAEVRVINNVWCLDTAAPFGGKLTALRYPEMELVEVKSLKQYQPFRPF